MVAHNLAQQFSKRLRDAMINNQFTSNRSPSGVSIAKLAEITAHSVQICRQYLRGRAMPDYLKMVEIANALKVSPGWLAFGDDSQQKNNKHCVSDETLHYLFTKVLSLNKSEQTKEGELPHFFTELIKTIRFINGTEEQNKKIIDIAFVAGKEFQEPNSH